MFIAFKDDVFDFPWDGIIKPIMDEYSYIFMPSNEVEKDTNSVILYSASEDLERQKEYKQVFRNLHWINQALSEKGLHYLVFKSLDEKIQELNTILTGLHAVTRMNREFLIDYKLDFSQYNIIEEIGISIDQENKEKLIKELQATIRNMVVSYGTDDGIFTEEQGAWIEFYLLWAKEKKIIESDLKGYISKYLSNEEPPPKTIN